MKKIKVYKSNLEILVDDSDYEYLYQFTWELTRGYARRTEIVDGKQVTKLMHKEILGLLGKRVLIDHKDRNTLNNQRNNLRECSRSQNAANCKIHKHNTSGFKGVSWHKQQNKWRAYIVLDNRQKHLGIFASKELAAEAYNKAALIYFGEFANLNDLTRK